MVTGTADTRATLNICLADCDARHLLDTLQPMIAASTGLACTSRVPEASYVLRAIGMSEQEAEASLRFGVGRMTTEDEIFGAIEIIVTKLQVHA